MKKKKFQSTIEYAFLIGVVILAFIAINIYLKRGFQGKYREVADSLSSQYSPGDTQSETNITTNSTSLECTGGESCQDSNGQEYTYPEGATLTRTFTTQTLRSNETVSVGD